VPSSGFPYWLFQGFTTQNDVLLMNEAGTETYYDKPAVVDALQYWVDLEPEAQGHGPRGDRVGDDAEGLLREEDRDDVDHHRQPHQRAEQRKVRLRRGDAARRQASRLADRRRQLLPLQEDDAAQREAVVKFAKWMTSPERAAQWGIETGYVAVRPMRGKPRR
jgi:sn-glycerol 3-phosphate transport system substrate-binding protein